MQKSAKWALCLGGIVAVYTSLNLGAWWYLHSLQGRLQQQTGCTLRVARSHISVGVGVLQRVLDGAQVRCSSGAAPHAPRVVYSHSVRLELALWHPFSVKLTVLGGQKIGWAEPTPVWLAQSDGPALYLSVPLWQRGSGGYGAPFKADFLHVAFLQGPLAGQGVVLQQVQGKAVWNSQASAQESLFGLVLSAQQAAFTFWKDPVAHFNVVAALPGPATAHTGLWRGLGIEAQHVATQPPSGQAARLERSSGVPDIVVQTIGGTWRGLSVGWSARLWVAATADVQGESWLTLPNWRSVMATVQAQNRLTPYQRTVLQQVQQAVEQQHTFPDGPLTLALPVRNGQVSLGPCRLSVTRLSCPDML
ncbi:MAG: DUF2125 domain-containing protein [Acetobacter orientalis]|uniref:hypothetical protein n=1 Tax=Acetobacter orientalis TaxID=146474 RepID=UPI0039E7DF9C